MFTNDMVMCIEQVEFGRGLQRIGITGGGISKLSTMVRACVCVCVCEFMYLYLYCVHVHACVCVGA